MKEKKRKNGHCKAFYVKRKRNNEINEFKPERLLEDKTVKHLQMVEAKALYFYRQTKTLTEVYPGRPVSLHTTKKSQDADN